MSVLLMKRGIVEILRPPIVDSLISKFKHSKSSRRLTQEEMRFVVLNQEAYKNPELRKSIGQFEYLIPYSSLEIATFRSGNNIFMIYKGTSNKANFVEDLKIIGNVSNGVLNRSLANFDRVKKAFPRNRIFVSGHSLGGTKALYVAFKRGLQGVVFNPFTPNTRGILFNINMNTPLMTKIVNRDDILSNNILIINPPKLVVMVLKFLKRNFFNSHSIDTFRKEGDFSF